MSDKFQKAGSAWMLSKCDSISQRLEDPLLTQESCVFRNNCLLGYCFHPVGY